MTKSLVRPDGPGEAALLLDPFEKRYLDTGGVGLSILSDNLHW